MPILVVHLRTAKRCALYKANHIRQGFKNATATPSPTSTPTGSSSTTESTVLSQLMQEIGGYSALFSHEGAAKLEIQQLASSGCGVTALCNVLVALKMIDCEQARMLDWSDCILRTRLNDAPLPEYLLSRSVAGCTGQDLVTSMASLMRCNHQLMGSTSHIGGEFVSYTEIISSGLSFHSFVLRNLQEGKAMVALLNLQLLGNDAWHHQMIYGIDTLPDSADGSSPNKVYCVNPICAYPTRLVEQMVSTESVLLVRGEDILKRHARPGGDVSIYDQPEWKRMGVKAQVQALVESSVSGAVGAEDGFVAIPANYVGGLAIFRRVDVSV